MNDVVVRRAREPDVAALVELRGVLFEAMGIAERDGAWREQARQWFTGRLDDPSYRVAVVDVGGTVVACAVGAIRDAAPAPDAPAGRDVLISNVCAYPSTRGRGYGSAAFTAVMEWARESGVERAELLSTRSGESMYRDAGFTSSEHPVMRAPLRRPHTTIDDTGALGEP